MILGENRLGKPVTKDMYKYDDNCNGLTFLII